MPQIKQVSDGAIFTVSENPAWVAGMWECGNMRFTDPSGDQYEVVELGTGQYPVLEPMDFYLAFTSDERRAIKASTDENVKELWDTYERCERTGKPIDCNRPSVQRMVGYLAQKSTDTPPGPGIITADRIPQILAGIPQ